LDLLACDVEDLQASPFLFSYVRIKFFLPLTSIKQKSFIFDFVFISIRLLYSLGIGGFHVKVRGQRRRQDPSSSTTDLLQDDNLHDESSSMNKRKRDRRPLKKKSVLEEHMPPEMQEAFFGSDLAEKSRLMAQHHIPIVPLQLNDQTTAINNNNHEYTIKLDHDTVNRFLIKKATKLALAVKEEQRQQQQPIVPVPTPSSSLQPPTITPPDDENDMRKISRFFLFINLLCCFL
jgi:hypothetical protein